MPETTPKNLILCVHSHQPVGNFDSVFKDAYDRSYKPFFEVLDRHASIRIACHFSGSLIDWLEAHQPDFIRLLKTMARRGQLEFIGGGYYEPIYGFIPKNDLVGQIEMMSWKIKALFGKVPEGVWLTERVWDPDLTAPLAGAGVQYTILDDFHFESTGKASPVTGYYRAKSGDKELDLFASMKQLRYLMPFRKAEETLKFIHSSAAQPQDVFVFADDCEKFGLWPGTYDWVYNQGWLDHFLTLLEKDESIRLYTFSQFRRKFKPKGFVKIPHASYSEMMEWSGGRFYNFLNKYPESRYMRDRMWGISRNLQKAISKNGSHAPKLGQKARESLYKAQCNCPYWHGVFGGLYLHHLRSAVFENLIKADSLIHAHSHKGSGHEMECVGFESGDRWQLRQKELVSFFNPRYGASLEELDFTPKAVNLMCNLQRHKEPYHETVLKKKPVMAGSSEPLSIHELLGSKESGLEKHLHYDLYRRLSFMDHLFDRPITLEAFSECSYKERGDFINAAYKARRIPAKDALEKILFERKGVVEIGGRKLPLRLKKTVAPVRGNSLEVSYEWTNESRSAVSFVFGNEFNFSIGDDYARKSVSEKSVREWIFHDSWRGIQIRLEMQAEVWLLAAPVETVSESEMGLERTYQELGVLLQRKVKLKPGEAKEHRVTLTVS
ncbi:MAG: hypothetical protein A3C47_03550 [Omnitrophica bacterium RIFCSPHIGHO2_02_FULL_51_18]|nr:MAG: hypothetical protein A3C47_03550 [Omnitrophica bacterium RIFCSPHIGHO2_02_FULL_51_18]